MNWTVNVMLGIVFMILGMYLILDGLISFAYYTINAEQSKTEHLFRFIRAGIGVVIMIFGMYMMYV